MIDLIILNRNLRLLDNPALYNGSLKSNYLVIYLYDDAYWYANGKSARQLKFSNDCLAELNKELKKFDSQVNVFEGSFDNLKVWINSNFDDFVIHINHCTDINYFRNNIPDYTFLFAWNHKKEIIIMHPGPINVDLEITDDIATSEKALISTQVENGLYIRAALLSLIS